VLRLLMGSALIYDGMMSLARCHQGVGAPLHVAHAVGRA
jgi:hypothetical protein